MDTTAAPTATTTQHGTVTLGATTYQVSVVHSTWTEASTGEVHHGSTTELTGPRGAVYFLRRVLERAGARWVDNGLRQVISWKSGQPLRVHGNEVRVRAIGDIIEVAK